MTFRVAGSWHKSTRCGEASHCVEIADFGHTVGIRNSTSPNETIQISRPAFQDLVTRIKNGELDA
ncbi:DUF397 domain-containing protein [Rhizocola hellebori]|uniref:DUF397 domain-containing protein n=1 Tax=Rhizocola hellebori TaxID=1392758 RepID=UPI00194348C3|nr:DUF397 domain-containing protein [Rhizocola hellebori]